MRRGALGKLLNQIVEQLKLEIDAEQVARHAGVELKFVLCLRDAMAKGECPHQYAIVYNPDEAEAPRGRPKRVKKDKPKKDKVNGNGSVNLQSSSELFGGDTDNGAD